MRPQTIPIVVGILLSASGLAYGQPKSTSSTPLSRSLTGEAAQAYSSAKILFDDGDRAGARQKFKRAFDLSRDPRLLWNMAVCEKELRHYARAKLLVDQYLQEGGSLLTDEDRATAMEAAVALRAFYSLVTVEGAPDGSSVFVDGSLAGTTPLKQPLTVDLGTRVVRVSHEEYEAFSTTLDVSGNGIAQIDVRMHEEVQTARLKVSSPGARGVISIDGKVLGTSHWEGPLSPGQHRLRVTADGKKPFETVFVLAPRSTRELTVTLQNESHRTLVWPWVLGGGAAIVAAIGTGYFLSRSKDQPGSTAPNGDLATVVIPPAIP